jgi:hypothetical protein
VVKRSRIDTVALVERGGPSWYWGGFNLVAILWRVIAFLLCPLLVPAVWISTMVALLLTGIGYYVTVLLVRPFMSGSRPQRAAGISRAIR